MERQHHGLIVEKLVKSALKSKKENSSSYTDEWDISLSASRDGIPVSIKTIKEDGRIDLGSAQRQWKINQVFRLVLVSYKNVGKKKIITSIDNYLIHPKKWRKLLGTLSVKELEKVHDHLVNNFPKGTHKAARKWWKKVREGWQNKGKLGKIVPSAKIDSKEQRRWQCGISRKDLCDEFGPLSKKLVLNKFKFPKVIK